MESHIQRASEETRCLHMGYSFRLTARVLLYALSHRQDCTYHGLCYTSHGALAGTRNSSMGPPWRIDPTTHRIMSEASYHGTTFRSRLQYKDNVISHPQTPPTPLPLLRQLPIPVGLLVLPCTRQCRVSPLLPPPWQACATTACSECAR